MFFVTASQLLPQDTDTAYDIYDARDMHAGLALPDPTGPGTTRVLHRGCVPTGTTVSAAAGRTVGHGELHGPGQIVSQPKQENLGAKAAKPKSPPGRRSSPKR